MVLYPRQNSTFAFHIHFPLFLFLLSAIQHWSSTIQLWSSIMRHWIFTTHLVFRSSTHVTRFLPFDTLWWHFMQVNSVCFIFLWHAWMIYISKGKAPRCMWVQTNSYGAISGKRVKSRLPMFPGSQPGLFSKCCRLNKPCWLFDKAPETVLEENYSWLPITQTLEFWRG